QDPVPVIRAGACRPSQSNASATAGNRARTTASQSFRPPVSKKPRIVVGAELRVNSGAWNTAAVGTGIPGKITRYQESPPSQTGVSLSPIPSAQADLPATKMGTSAPNLAPIAAISSEARPVPHSLLSASSTVAASELPPPRPPPIGMTFRTEISAPSGVPVADLSAR